MGKRVLIFFIIILIPLSETLQANKIAPPFPADKLVGIWVGFDKIGVSFTRLDLRPGLSGYVSLVGTNSLGVYRISNPQYDGYHFTMDLLPISQDAEDGIRVSTRPGYRMDLAFHRKGLKWEVRVFPEKDVDDFNGRAKAAIEAATK